MKKIFSFLAVALMALTMSATQLPQDWHKLTQETTASDVDDVEDEATVEAMAVNYAVGFVRFLIRNVGDDNFLYLQTSLNGVGNIITSLDTAEFADLKAQSNAYQTYYYVEPAAPEPPVVPATVDTTYSVKGWWNDSDVAYWVDLHRSSPGVDIFVTDTLVYGGGKMVFCEAIGTDSTVTNISCMDLPVMDEDGQTMNYILQANDTIVFCYQTAVPTAPTYAAFLIGQYVEVIEITSIREVKDSVMYEAYVHGVVTYVEGNTLIMQDSTAGIIVYTENAAAFDTIVPPMEVTMHGAVGGRDMMLISFLSNEPTVMPEPLVLTIPELNDDSRLDEIEYMYTSLECVSYVGQKDFVGSSAPSRYAEAIEAWTLASGEDTLYYMVGFPADSYEIGDDVTVNFLNMRAYYLTRADWVEACGGPTPPPATEDVFCGHNWGGMGDITFEEMKMEDEMGMFLDLYKYVGVWGDGSVWIATYSDGRDKVEYPLSTIEFLDAQLRVQATAEVGEEVTFLYEPYIKHVAVYMHNATGIDEMIADPTFRKVLMNNQVVIIRDGKFYDLMGQELR